MIFARRNLTLAVAILVATTVAVLASFAPLPLADAHTLAVVAGTGLAMAVPSGNPGLHPTAQHVINSLEAHFAAVGKALEAGAPDWMKAHVESAFADVKAKLDEFGAEFANEFEALKARVTGAKKAAATTAPAAAEPEKQVAA
jgi:hypothetical protein